MDIEFNPSTGSSITAKLQEDLDSCLATLAKYRKELGDSLKQNAELRIEMLNMETAVSDEKRTRRKVEEEALALKTENEALQAKVAEYETKVKIEVKNSPNGKQIIPPPVPIAIPPEASAQSNSRRKRNLSVEFVDISRIKASPSPVRRKAQRLVPYVNVPRSSYPIKVEKQQAEGP
ncbi:hypothetical protein BDQ12DRAFT_690180 [Crucibulum laeve]|uniref:Uncharacterized protein n=1 Tax=Crucibulum laeve TaxID=68775 RepID=A0A5C3LNF0_9AGAR|nr:hypothetical protein BDQ12DRAFT_690180 [Crucibulum laeve]